MRGVLGFLSPSSHGLGLPCMTLVTVGKSVITLDHVLVTPQYEETALKLTSHIEYSKDRWVLLH